MVQTPNLNCSRPEKREFAKRLKEFRKTLEFHQNSSSTSFMLSFFKYGRNHNHQFLPRFLWHFFLQRRTESLLLDPGQKFPRDKQVWEWSQVPTWCRKGTLTRKRGAVPKREASWFEETMLYHRRSGLWIRHQCPNCSLISSLHIIWISSQLSGSINWR